MTKSPYDAASDSALMSEIWSPAIAENPLAFVLFAYPWGKPNTPLEKWQGPRAWQRDELENITLHIAENKNRIRQGKEPIVYQSATASGRGPGKSALVAWLNHWMMSCNLGSTSINTANTEAQLKSRTWAELGKWHTLAINAHWFEKMALSLKPEAWFDEALKRDLKIDTGYYYSQAQLWSEDNPDAFAGVHNHNGILLIFDEASGIPPSIWRVSEGFFTDPVLHRYWFVFSNPRRNTGSFFECFHKDRNYWRRRQIDSRDVEGTDKKVLQDIVDKHGEDSDDARVEVKGEFPRQGDKQFISRSIVDAAVERDLIEDAYAPLIMGVDPARFGDDATVIFFRQGRNARVIAPIEMRGKDNMEVANECAHLITKYNPDGVCVDAGNGTGIIDRLREMGYKVTEVWFGSSSSKEEYANKRTELWADMRDWVGGACLPDIPELVDDLVGPQYKYMGTSDKQMLETKEAMKSRGIASPDYADALACTFFIRFARKDSHLARGSKRKTEAQGIDYDIFGK